MAELYRKSALEKISSPEQLDKTLTVTSPMSWIALIAVTAMIVATVIWSFTGDILTTVTAKGIVRAPVSTNAIYARESGEVVTVYLIPGDKLSIGRPVLSYRTGSNEVRDIDSDQMGVVTDVQVKPGDKISPDSELVRFSPPIDARQVVVCYVKQSDAAKITRGMKANVFLDSVDSHNYGHMKARVETVDSGVSSAKGMAYVLGEDNNQIAYFQENGEPVVAVTLQIYHDTTGKSKSGYQWSTVKGAEKMETINDGALVHAKIVVESNHPIYKLFYKLKEIMGD